MLEIAEAGSEISKSEYEAELPDLRVALLNAQFDLRSAGFPVLVLIVGDDRIGCNEAVRTLHEWMDARYLRTHVFGPPNETELQRPRFWRYWMNFPRKGQVGIYLGGLVLDAVAAHIRGEIDQDELDHRCDEGRTYEQTLSAEGALVLRFWLHLPKKEHKKRLKKARKESDKAWRVEEADFEICELYDEAMPVVERALRKSATASAPWHVVESTNARYRDLTISRTILSELEKRLAAPRAEIAVQESVEDAPGPDPFESVDLSRTLSRDEYREQLETLQARLNKLARRSCEKGIPSVLVFEGWDAAGKGGAIRRITQAIDVRDYSVIPIAAPDDEERAHHYLWRFWKRVPPNGRIAIFDRSWYGRVLVERVEGFASESEWRRAYAEITDFEEQLVEHGCVLLKFWLHIDPDEQLQRFREREKTPYKKYKITEEDYRNRERWDAYTEAVRDMVARTSTDLARWHLVPANDKRWARIEVLQTYCDALKAATKGR